MEFNFEQLQVVAKPVVGDMEAKQRDNDSLSESVMEALLEQQSKNNNSDAAQQIIDDILRETFTPSSSSATPFVHISPVSQQQLPYASVVQDEKKMEVKSGGNSKSYATVVAPPIIKPFVVDEQKLDFLQQLFPNLPVSLLKDNLHKYRNDVDNATNALVKVNDKNQAARDAIRKQQGLKTEAEELADVLELKAKLDQQDADREALEAQQAQEVALKKEHEELMLREIKEAKKAARAVMSKQPEEAQAPVSPPSANEAVQQQAQKEVHEEEEDFELIDAEEELVGFEDQEDAKRSQQKQLFIHVDPQREHRRILVSWPLQTHASHDYVAMIVSQHATQEEALKPENLPEANAKGLTWFWCSASAVKTMPDMTQHNVLTFECTPQMLEFGHIRFYYFSKDNGVFYCNAVSNKVWVGPDFEQK